ncbi:MAG: Uma2 family endonuclease [Gemmataceae bacterium]|nr:Uma2 family endonuclease [Gemmataceae bacterium]
MATIAKYAYRRFDKPRPAPTWLVAEDGEPLDTPWHRAAIALLIEILAWFWRGRSDYYAGGNMFIYYSEKQAREYKKRKNRGPDFYVVKGVDGRRKRDYWWVPGEGGRFPNMIVELASRTTRKIDRTTKKDIYEQIFKTPEYFIYDPDTKKLMGWRLAQSVYEPIAANDKGWLWCEQLGLFLGTWQGEYLNSADTWLRFYDADGILILTQAEDVHAKAEQSKQELNELKSLLQEKGISIASLKSKQKDGKRKNHRNGK